MRSDHGQLDARDRLAELELMMQKIRVHDAYARVCLKHEAPAIGPGWRTLGLLHEGRKWVRVEEISSGRRARLLIAVCRNLIRSRPVATPRETWP